MGRSNYYTSPSTRIRSLKRALKYFIEHKVQLRKLPVLTIDQTSLVDIPPFVVPERGQPNALKTNLSKQTQNRHVQPKLTQFSTSPKPNDHLTKSSQLASRTFKSGRRQLPPQPPPSKLEWCFERCPVTGAYKQTFP
jgi:hypothetical protein